MPFWETPWFTGTAGSPERVKRAFAGVVATREAYRDEITVDLPSGRRSFDFSTATISLRSSVTGRIVDPECETAGSAL